MGKQANVIIIGITVGLAAGIFLLFLGCICFRKWRHNQLHASRNSAVNLPIRMSGIGTSIEFSASLSNARTSYDPQHIGKSYHKLWWRRPHHSLSVSPPVIKKYLFKDIQKATHNFTTLLGQGSFGSVYKAVMPTGEAVAVKALASNSNQGEREFYTEISLLGRLHHRNLVNLVGYCVDKGQCMLIYEFMSNGSLANWLHGESNRALSWDERLQVAHDISYAIEYLHEGAIPPVIHRDLKTANILLDQSMQAKVADFGLSREEEFNSRTSCFKGTYGYIDPEYMSTNRFTKKSDIYSFGIVLFELVTAISPQQGLLDYVELGAIGADGNGNWEEIIDIKLVGKCNHEEIRCLANIAYHCIQKSSKLRPYISDVSQAISKIRKQRLRKSDTLSSYPSSGSDVSDALRSDRALDR